MVCAISGCTLQRVFFLNAKDKAIPFHRTDNKAKFSNALISDCHVLCSVNTRSLPGNANAHFNKRLWHQCPVNGLGLVHWYPPVKKQQKSQKQKQRWRSPASTQNNRASATAFCQNLTQSPTFDEDVELRDHSPPIIFFDTSINSQHHPGQMTLGRQHPCCLLPAITAASLSGEIWHQDASAPCHLLPATTAASLSRGTWHWKASAPCRLLPATTTTGFGQAFGTRMPEPPAVHFQQPQQLDRAKAPGTRMPAPPAVHFQQPQQLALAGAPGTRIPASPAVHF